jgi:hypothetical protein
MRAMPEASRSTKYCAFCRQPRRQLGDLSRGLVICQRVEMPASAMGCILILVADDELDPGEAHAIAWQRHQRNDAAGLARFSMIFRARVRMVRVTDLASRW